MVETLTNDQMIEEARKYYDERLKGTLEPQHDGAYVVVSVEDGLHAVGNTLEKAHLAMEELHPRGPLVCLRVGRDYTLDLHAHE